MLRMHSRRLTLRSCVLATIAGTAVAMVATPVGAAGGNGSSGSSTRAKATVTVVGKAAPDECWQPPADPSVASDYGVYSTSAPSYNAKKKQWTCPVGYVPKVNQAYVWGLTRTGSDLWFGTVANTQCLVMGSYLGLTDPMLNTTSVCEFGQSPTVQQGLPSYGIPPNTISAGLGDWRPPKLLKYTMGQTAQPVDLTSLNTSSAAGTINWYLAHTVGIRSATSVDDPFSAGRKVIIFAGPSLQGSLTMLAFHDDGTFIAAKFLPYNDIRRWVSTGGSVYTGVGKTDSTGAVLKWAPVAATDTTAADYLSFTELTQLGSDVAELTLAGNRLVAGTWPSSTSQASVWLSPPGVAIADLNSSNASDWIKVWQADSYDPDPTTAVTYGAGAMASYNGYIYWGTMHVPGVSFEAAETAHPSSTPQETLANFVGSYRAISIFRVSIKDASNGDVQLLYGDAQLPAYDQTSGSWQIVNNNMGGVAGLYGASGLGNEFNNYTWSMGVYGDKLYVGTMDWSYLASQTWPAIAGQFGLPSDTPNPLDDIATYGADLFRFPSTTAAATALYTDGVGNYLSYGLRNMLPVEDATSANNGLYLGMANPENLATSSGIPKGGWELIKLTTK